MENERKELVLNPEFQPQKHTMKRDMAMPGNQTIGQDFRCWVILCKGP